MKKFLPAVVFLSLLCMSCSKIPPDNGSLTGTTRIFQLNHIDNISFTADNGVLISGAFNNRYTLIKTYPDLIAEWTRNDYSWGNLVQSQGWGGSSYYFAMKKVFPVDNGYVCIGTVFEGGDFIFAHTLILILDAFGEQVNSYELQDMSTLDVLRTADKGYLLLGTKLVKLNSAFVQEWTRQIYDYVYYPEAITNTADGGFAITGSDTAEQVYLKIYDANGNDILTHTYRHNQYPFEEYGTDLQQLPDNGFLIAGRSGRSFVPNYVECQIIRTDAVGDTLWTRRIEYPGNCWLDKIVSNDQDNYILQGSIGFPNEQQSSLLFRVNLDGQILDSLNTGKFQMLLRSPLGYYVKVSQYDADHMALTMIGANELFGH